MVQPRSAGDWREASLLKSHGAALIVRAPGAAASSALSWLPVIIRTDPVVLHPQRDVFGQFPKVMRTGTRWARRIHSKVGLTL